MKNAGLVLPEELARLPGAATGVGIAYFQSRKNQRDKKRLAGGLALQGKSFDPTVSQLQDVDDVTVIDKKIFLQFKGELKITDL